VPFSGSLYVLCTPMYVHFSRTCTCGCSRLTCWPAHAAAGCACSALPGLHLCAVPSLCVQCPPWAAPTCAVCPRVSPVPPPASRAAELPHHVCASCSPPLRREQLSCLTTCVSPVPPPASRAAGCRCWRRRARSPNSSLWTSRMQRRCLSGACRWVCVCVCPHACSCAWACAHQRVRTAVACACLGGAARMPWPAAQEWHVLFRRSSVTVHRAFEQ